MQTVLNRELCYFTGLWSGLGSICNLSSLFACGKCGNFNRKFANKLPKTYFFHSSVYLKHFRVQGTVEQRPVFQMWNQAL